MILFAVILFAGLSFAADNETVFIGDSTNFTCCHLWCCYRGSPYCDATGIPGCSQGVQTDGGTFCRPSQNATLVDLCGSGDYLEWTTPDLAGGNYTINITAGCVAWGSCANPPVCTAELYIDGAQRGSLTFRDTDVSDKKLTRSNYTYNATLSGTHTIRVYYSDDCFGGSSGDRNFYLYGINITTDKNPDLYINGSEIWIVPENLSWNVNEGTSVGFIVTVRNIGNTTASNFSVRFKDNDNPEDIHSGFVQEKAVDSLPANSSVNVTFSWNATGPTREVSFFADSWKTVAESNESNNIAFHIIRITPAKPPDYTPYIIAAGAAILLLALIASALIAWRMHSYVRPGGAQSVCPRCGMSVAAGTKKCPVCGKKLV